MQGPLGYGNVLYSGWGGGHEGVYIYQKSGNCTFKIGIFYFMYIYLNKVVFKTRVEVITTCQVIRRTNEFFSEVLHFKCQKNHNCLHCLFCARHCSKHLVYYAFVSSSKHYYCICLAYEKVEVYGDQITFPKSHS